MDDMEKTFIKKFLDQACSVVGCPYIWGGKGNQMWTPSGLVDIAVKLGPNPNGPELGFDCMGLVAWATWKSGGPDLRATFNAQLLFNWMSEKSPLALGVMSSMPCLHFYGYNARSVTHVSIGLNNFGEERLVLEAAGAGSDSISWARAHSLGARVRVGRDLRSLNTLQYSAPLVSIISVMP